MRTMRIRLNYITPVLAASAIAAAPTAAAAVQAQQAAIATVPIAVTDHVVPAARGGGGPSGRRLERRFLAAFLSLPACAARYSIASDIASGRLGATAPGRCFRRGSSGRGCLPQPLMLRVCYVAPDVTLKCASLGNMTNAQVTELRRPGQSAAVSSPHTGAQPHERSELEFRGAKGIRTPDPHTASVVRYQLRHSP